MAERDAEARRLAQLHFDIEPDISRIFYHLGQAGEGSLAQRADQAPRSERCDLSGRRDAVALWPRAGTGSYIALSHYRGDSRRVRAHPDARVEAPRRVDDW